MTVETTTLTPMMAQWKECKDASKEALLFFRLGDFYEAFYEDARLMSHELDLTLTERQGVPMCGVPFHSHEPYLDKLVSKGYKVAVAEQVEDPKQTKGLVHREVVRIASPGTLISSTLLNEKKPNFIASLYAYESTFGLALIDLTTASFSVFETKDTKELLSHICKAFPKELLITKKLYEQENEKLSELKDSLQLRLQIEEDWRFDRQHALLVLIKQFKMRSLDGFGLKNMDVAITAAGALLSYLYDSHIPTEHIQQIEPFISNKWLLMDRQTLQNLEILETLDERTKQTSLFSLIDETRTAMGARKLREWLQSPLIEVDAIIKRQDAVEELLLYEAIDQILKEIKDLERLAIRLKTGFSCPKDYVALRASLERIPQLKALLSSSQTLLLQELLSEIQLFELVVNKLREALQDSCPVRLSDGNIFNQGYSKELDELSAVRKSSHEWLASYQIRLREETGIKTLKVNFTRMFGYYIEVSKLQSERMPPSFIRRQTLVNAERYLSAELKEFEDKVLTADEKIAQLELRLYEELTLEIGSHLDAIALTARSIASIDALRALAFLAKKRGYIRPKVSSSKILDIEDGRHPVIEALSQAKRFVPNDLLIDGQEKNLLIITGPNMAGKSTFIRQIALLVILAQIGSFIPAKRAHIGVVDKLFSRIGASDDLARGLSTFMVEMTETASILHQATDRSLVILDEIGRGTSTYDGISIAWAVAEYLVKNRKKWAKTLFATHYYELTNLEKESSRAVNYTVAVSEVQGSIRFLHKIIPGKTDKSYGVHVAELAGLPEEVTKRAKEILQGLERKELTIQKNQLPKQPDLFSPKQEDQNALKELKDFQVQNSTPIQCLLFIEKLQKALFKNNY